MIVIRNSERTAIKRCVARWNWAFNDGLTPKQVDTKLWFGGGIHLALAEWYQHGFNRGPHPAKTWAEFVKNETRYVKDNQGLIDDVKWIDARDLGMHMLLSYVDEYGDDPYWDVLATEQTFQVKSRTRTGLEFIIAGTFDGVYRDTQTGKLMLMEHKTAAGLPNTGYLELDDQANTYFAVAEIVMRHKGWLQEGEHLDGIMYNYLKKSMPDDRPKDEQGRALNKDGRVSKVQPGPLFMRYPAWRSTKQRINTLENIKHEVELMQAYRVGDLGIIKTPTKDCAWDCAFFQMCQLHEAGEDWEEFRDAMFVKVDPYTDHRAEMKGAE